MEEKITRFIGIDLAKRSYVAHVSFSDERKPERFSGSTSKAGTENLISRFGKNDRIAMESCSYAFFLAKEIIERAGCEVYVLNAGQLAIIYKSTKKTDLEDAAKLSWMLKRFPPEELPAVALPDEKELHRRALVSELGSKKKIRNKLINRLHSLYVRVGITGMEKKDLKTAKTREENRSLLSSYSFYEALRIEEELELFERHIDAIEAEIAMELSTEPLAENLMSIPGVGPATAMAFLAHVGDGSRFRNGRQVSHFVGITPRVDNSGETVRLGNITKRGCTAIRGIIVQSAWAAVHAKADNPFRRKYLELVERRGKGRAIVAIARRMLEVMWIVTTRNERYRWSSETMLMQKKYLLSLKLKKAKILELGVLTN